MAGRFVLDRLPTHATRSGRVKPAAILIMMVSCLVAATVALPAVATASSPHLADKTTTTCVGCHVPHQAATADNIFRSEHGSAGETPLCFACHDGVGADSNVKTGPDSFSLASGHVLEGLVDTTTPSDLTNTCSDCHKPHGDPALKPKLPATTVNGVAVGTTGNTWCLACHDDAQSWYAGIGTYPALAAPARDASGYPVAGVFAGASVYTSPTANAHIGIPASSGISTRTAGDCLYCHNAHGSASRYDSLNATLAPSTQSGAGHDRETGDYAALCLGCHSGGSWEASGAANIKQYVTHGAGDTSNGASGGHRVKSPGGKLPVNAPLPCYDCHNPHGSSRGNKTLISDALGGSLDTSAGPEAVRRFCLACHATSDLFGWESTGATYTAVGSTATVEGLARNGGANGSGPGGNGKNWLLLKVTPGHQRADVTMSCYECHGNDYGVADSKNVHDPGAYSVALHTGTATSATITILGVDYPSQACADCHGLELGPEHAKPTSVNNALACSECHPNPRASLTPSWDRTTCAQGDCHAGTSAAPMHAEKDADHAAPTNSCTAAGCHTAVLGLAALHSEASTTVAGDERTSCQVCHAAGVPSTNDCETCHPGDPHPDADHSVSGPCTPSGCHATDAIAIHDSGPKCSACHAAGTTPSFACRECHEPPHTEANHENAASGYIGTDICWSCHSTGNLMKVHEDDCTKCHPTPADGMTWNGTCSQTGCHPDYHSGITDPQGGGHPYDHGYGDDCWDCHDQSWFDLCEGCHTWTYERGAPITTSDARATYTGSAFIRLTAVDQGEGSDTVGVRGTYYQLDGGPIQTGTSIIIQGPTSGIQAHTIEFWSTDLYNNAESPHKYAHFTIAAGGPDTNPPAGTMAINAGATYANKTDVTINSAVTDAESGVVSMRVDPRTGTFGSWVPYLEARGISLSATNGTKTVRVEYRDVDNNVLALSDTIILDTVLPTGSMVVNSGAVYTNSLTVTVTASVTDALSGLVDMRLEDNGSWVWSGWEPYSATKIRTLAGTFNGTRNVYAQYRDAAGNVLQLLDTIIYDGTAPTGTMSVNNNATYATSTSATLNSTISDTGGSLLTQMRVDPGSGAFGSWVSYNAAYAFTLAAGDGTKTVRSEYRDGAGNTLARSDTIILDTAGPIGTMVVAGDATSTISASVDIDSAMSDVGSGVFQMRVDPGSGTWGSWVAYAATFPITLPVGDGLKTVRVEYKDNAGFVTLKTDTITLTAGAIDTTPPVGSVIINGGAAWTNVTTSTLTLSASDPGGSGVMQMQFSDDNVTWSGWETYSTSKTWALSAATGIKTVYARYQDAALNISDVYSDTIGLDITSPNGTMLVNGGATTAVVTAATVNSSVSDGLSGMSQMRVDPGTGSFGAWVTYSASYSFTLPMPDGTKIVRAEYRDNAGNVLALTDSIYLNTTGVGGPRSFAYTGTDQLYVVPVGVTTLEVDVYGAEGGGYDGAWGGLGGHVHAVIPVTPRQVLTIRVGGEGADSVAGWPNGGAAPHGGGGGGSSSIIATTTILVEAGGGGGGDHVDSGESGGPGGAQGWLPGGNQTGGSIDGAGGGGGWNGGTAYAQHDGGADGGTSYIASGLGTLNAGANSGNGRVDITPGPIQTGTITFMWDAPDWGEPWANYYIYNSDGALVDSASDATIPGWHGWYTATVPVDPLPYTWHTAWYDPDWGDGTTDGTALIDSPGKAESYPY